MVSPICRLKKERDQLYPNILTVRVAEGQLKVLRRIIERGLNKNQLLILGELAGNGHYLTVTSCLGSLSRKSGVALSTLRWNVDVLKDLGLIGYEKGNPVRLSDPGKLVCEILGGEK
ncbi:MAG: hypothetical protein ISS48_02585 [Candidatus Aenigmarchaeota archaeon]|nr:hypothetical protein [Candidatus Aenigmarchaeota archaeon]